MSWRDKTVAKQQNTNQPQSGWRSKIVSGNASNIPSAVNTIQEQADYISPWQRFVAKNFANSPDAQLAYLKKKNPDKEFALLAGEIVTKSKGDQNWKVLDPKGFDLQDIPDMAYDIPAGIAQGAATTAGFIAGAPTVLGALPSAMAASAFSGGALEAVRQGVGKIAGIPQDISGGDVAFATGLGAASPLMFGVDKIKGPLQSEARGLIKRGVDKVGPAMVEFATAIPADVQAGYRAYKNQVDDIARNGKQFEFVNNLSEKVQSALGNRQQELGQKVASAVDSAGTPVDITKAKQVFADRLSFLRSKPYLTNAEQAEINSLQSYYTKYFGLNQPLAPSTEELLSSPEAQRIYKNIDTMVSSGVPSAPSAAKLPSPKLTYDPYHDSFLSSINKYANDGLDDMSADLASKREDSIKQSLAELAQIRQRMSLAELPDNVDAKRAFDLQQKLKQAAAFETNMTPETLSAKGSARGAYGNINQALDDATAGLSGEAKENYSAFKTVQDEVERGFSTPQKTYNTVVGLSRPGRMSMLGRLQSLAGDGTLDIAPEVDQLRALSAFHDIGQSPYLTKAPEKARTGFKAVSTGAGTLLGYKLGGGTGSVFGGAIGAGIGQLGSSKDAARGYINLGNMVDKAAAQNYYLNPAFYQSQNPWEERKP